MVSPAQTHESSLRSRVNRVWRDFSATTGGDICATVISLCGIVLLFLAGAFGVMGFGRAITLILHLLGAG